MSRGEALFRAIKVNDPLQVIGAIKRGANVDVVDKEVGTPLMFAVEGRQPTIITALLCAGADVDKQVGGTNALATALVQDDVDHEIFSLLLSAGADANAYVFDTVHDSECDVPILALAVYAQAIETVPLLLAAGAEWEPDLAGEFNDDDEIDELVALVCNSHVAKKELELVGFRCCRQRAFDVCVALQGIGCRRRS
jgi:ankyrin repeat protein